MCLFTYFVFDCTGSLLLCAGFPSCGDGGYGQLTVVVSLVAEHRLSDTRASVVVVYGLSLPEAFGISLDQGSNPRPLY